MLPPTIAAFGATLRRRELSAREAAEASLALAEATQQSLNAFIAISPDTALAAAEHVDRALAAGDDLGPLMGVPVAVKDVFDVAGLPTTAGSRAFADNLAAADSAAVARLRAGGAVIVGKANMDQFAFGPHQDDYGRTNCPADPSRYAGGSSGGSAAAVAAGIVLAALGSDAGGSTRFPAACCGVVGFKGTFGRVSTDGVFPTFPTLDHVATIARRVADVADVADVLAPLGPLPDRTVRPPRLAPLAGWADGCSPPVAEALESALGRLTDAGAEVVAERSIAGFDACLPTLVATVGPEAVVALEPVAERAAPALPPPLAELLEAARDQPAVDYVRAQRVRRELRAAADQALDGVDALVMPTSLDVAWAWAEIDGGAMGVRDRTTRFLPLANLTGQPALSLPVPSGGPPVGLQLVGRVGGDEQLLATAAWIEQALAPPVPDPKGRP